MKLETYPQKGRKYQKLLHFTRIPQHHIRKISDKTYTQAFALDILIRQKIIKNTIKIYQKHINATLNRLFQNERQNVPCFLQPNLLIYSLFTTRIIWMSLHDLVTITRNKWKHYLTLENLFNSAVKQEIETYNVPSTSTQLSYSTGTRQNSPFTMIHIRKTSIGKEQYTIQQGC